MRLSLLTACAALLVVGCGKSDPAKNGKGGDPKGAGDTAAADLTAAKPDHTATAADWHAEFKKDKVAAKAKYAGKVIELTGTVLTFAENVDAGILFVHLKVETDTLGVRCGLKDLTAWEKASDGAEVTVRGKLADGGFLTGELMPAAIAKVAKNPAEAVTAAELAKQFRTDLPKLKEKFDDKWVYVEGEVVSTGKTSVGSPLFALKGDGECVVTCNVTNDGKARVEALKAGQKVKVLGQFATYSGDKGPTLNMSMFKGQ